MRAESERSGLGHDGNRITGLPPILGVQSLNGTGRLGLGRRINESTTALVAVMAHDPDDRLAEFQGFPDVDDQTAIHLDPEDEFLLVVRLHAGWRTVKQGSHEHELFGFMIASADSDFPLGFSRLSDPDGPFVQ
ncbi:MAG: hypothetical protein M1333_01460 [Patescibacteria group bacterium]|nr:hypothetical protein [Patescibacteria group bacterium]